MIVGHRVRTRFPKEFHAHVRARGRVLRMVRPGFAGIIGRSFARLQHNGRVVRAVQAFWTLHAQTKTPGRLVAVSNHQDRVMFGNRRGRQRRRVRSFRGSFCRRLLNRRLGQGGSIWGGKMEKRESQGKKKDAHVNRPRNHGHTQKNAGAADVHKIRTEPRCTTQAKEVARPTGETVRRAPLTGTASFRSVNDHSPAMSAARFRRAEHPVRRKTRTRRLILRAFE